MFVAGDGCVAALTERRVLTDASGGKSPRDGGVADARVGKSPRHGGVG